MFIIGDIIARQARKEGKSVFFPIASHYSGNSAQNVSKTLTKIFSKNNTITEEEKKIFDLYKNFYNVPTTILKNFTNPLNILNFYNQEILWELKSLDVLGDYESSYTTNHEDFPIFINTIISLYKKHNMLISNKNNELALHYEDVGWKETTFELLDRIKLIQPFHKNNLITGMRNITSNWGLLREDGFGVIYGKKWIIDPMFDSELFTIFDLYVKFKKEYKSKSVNAKDIFENLFEVLKDKRKPQYALVKKILEWLPCDVFICEEHLKNWVAKKLYTESLLLNKKYQTKKYFVLGMGLLNGRRMSASKGNAILARNLINYYGTTKARLIIIMSGGNPSKTYSYDKQLPEQIDKLLNNFTNYYTYLISLANREISANNSDEKTPSVEAISEAIDDNISQGYYRQAMIELLSILPKKYKLPTNKTATILIPLYEKYLDILLPSLLSSFNRYKRN